ncbi:MAG: alkaline phosphatase family protein [Geodermatophilaceae bacterium]
MARPPGNRRSRATAQCWTSGAPKPRSAGADRRLRDFSKTALLINFDGRPIGLGPRLPMVAVSPWRIGGNVDSEVSDHTSVVRFLERWTA